MGSRRNDLGENVANLLECIALVEFLDPYKRWHDDYDVAEAFQRTCLFTLREYPQQSCVA